MKKVIIGIIILLVIVIFLLKPEESEIRCRVIPNSNSQDDLLVKEEVKEVVVLYMQMTYDKDLEVYKKNISNHLEDLLNAIKEIEEDVLVEFKMHTFYNKVDNNNNTIKNKAYLTLLVTIKEGKGDNWWASVYPKFLMIDSKEETKYKSFLEELFR